MKVIDIVLYIFKTLSFDKFTAQVSLRDRTTRRSTSARTKTGTRPTGDHRGGRRKGLNTTVELRRGRLLRAKLDFMVRDAIGRQWQLRNDPGGLQPARTFRPDL